MTIKLTGEEIKEKINVEKYNALVYQNNEPYRQLVERNWDQWQWIVAEAPWLSNWERSPYWNQRGLTPQGFIATEVKVTRKKKEVLVGAVAHVIYSDLVWGATVDQWFKPGQGILSDKRAYHQMLNKIMKEQKLKMFPRESNTRWDNKFYRGTGIQIPIEYGEMDDWLEQLWTQVL